MADEETDWFGWLLNPNNRRFYRYRINEEGETEFEYANGELDRILALNCIQRLQAQAPSASQRRRDSGFGGPSTLSPSSQHQSSFDLQSLRQNLPTGTNYPHYSVAQGSTATALQEDDGDGGDAEDETEATVSPQVYARPIAGTNSGPATESLDSRYKRVRNRDQAKFFTLGRVFLMLWTEPAGQTDPNAPRTRGSTHFSLVQYGEEAFTEIRRFIVVQPGERHSLCVPIQTYGNRGVANRGRDAIHHAIAYTTGQPPPTPLPRERMNKQSIQIDPNPNDPGSDTLGERSRINFSKTYTVEHNVKVRNAGKVFRDHRHLLDTYWKFTTFGLECPTCATVGREVLVRPGQRCRGCGILY